MNEIEIRIKQSQKDIDRLMEERKVLEAEKQKSENVDWRLLFEGTVVRSRDGEKAFVYYNSKIGARELLLLGCIHTANRLEDTFDNCEVIGKIDFCIKGS